MSKDPRSAASDQISGASQPAVSSASTASADPARSGAPRLAPRLVALALGGACLLSGLDAALLRLGAWAPVDAAALAAFHGPLMLVGFLGTVIGLERAVAARTNWAFLSPAGSALGCLSLVAGVPEPVGQVLALLGSAALCAVYVHVHRRVASIAVDVEAMGAIALTLGNLLWLRGMAIETCVPLWLLFPVLTVVGERLELARIAFVGGAVEEVVRALSAASLMGACMLAVTGTARLVIGPALLALAVVMARYDVARRTIRATGAVRFAAAAMLAGYFWLAVAGLAWSLGPLDAAYDNYDIIIHSIALGYAFSMILAHAPTIIPAIVHRRLPYHRAMWLPYALLHVGLMVRVVARLRAGVAELAEGTVWRAGGVLGVVAVLVFLLLTVARVATAGRIGAGRPAWATGPADPGGPTEPGEPAEPAGSVGAGADPTAGTARGNE